MKMFGLSAEEKFTGEGEGGERDLERVGKRENE